jgi:flagellar motility protein MotE (MotC chaperone)
MRAVELPSPRDLRRRLSPLPATLAALAALLLVKVAGFAPLPTTADVAATATLGEVAPAAPPAPPSAAAGETAPSVGHMPPASPGRVVPPPTAATADEHAHAARVIDELLAPAAGGDGGAMALEVAAADPLAAEPFLEERRALARQREALTVRKLAVDVAEERLEQLLEELGALKAEIDARLAALEAGDEKRLARLVKLYETMRPKDAARIFDDLDFDVLVPLALAMNERKLAPIVAAMTPKVARKLTGEVAERRAEGLAAALAVAPR